MTAQRDDSQCALICGVVCPCGPNGEPLACAFPPGHEPREHSWATLPTFFDGRTALERAAIEYVETSRAEADRVVRTGRAMDPKSPEWERKGEALGALIEAAEGTGARVG